MSRLLIRLLIVLSALGFLECHRAKSAPRPAHQRVLYVANKSKLTLYDIDDHHRRIGHIPLPHTGQFKGICASVPLGRIYVTSNDEDELLALDLSTEKIVWRRHYCSYADSMAITPNGQTIYLPCRHDGQWWVVDAKSGDVKAKIESGRGKPYDHDPIPDYGPHNTISSEDGSRMYLAVMTEPFVFIVDTASNKLVGKVGPFSRGVRPLAVNRTHLFVNVDGLLGFEVADLRTGKMIHRIEATTPPERIADVKDRKPHHHTPSHGIALRPGTNELWVSDDVYGYLYVYDVAVMPPKFLQAVPLFKKRKDQAKPAWISFSIDGRYAYPSCDVVVDAQKRTIAAEIDSSEKLLEIDFDNGRAVRAGQR